MRLAHALCGALAGLAFWLLVDVLPEMASARTVFDLSVFSVSLFVPFLLSAGALPPLRAALGSLALSVIVTGLAASASYRFASVDQFVETGHPIFAILCLTLLPVPFLIAGLGRDGRWLDYAILFDAAWAAAVRATAAALFLGAFWLFLFLSDALLSLVGLNLLDWFAEVAMLPFVLSGVVFGLGLSVAGEMPEFVSPHLPLRLLRLFLLPALAVISLFVAALPFRGLSGLFGTLSTAAVILAMIAAIAALVSAALDREDSEAPKGRMLRGAIQALIVLMPVLAVLAVYAVAERVGQYGWSPDRLAAMSVAVIGAAYALTYAAAVAFRRDWMGRIRQANVAVAIAIIALSAAWLSPLLNPQRLATASQIGRYAQGTVTAGELDLWAIGRTWGHAGAEGIAQLSAMGAEVAVPDDALVERLDALDRAESRAEFENWAPPSDRIAQIERLRAALRVHPAGSAIPEDLFDRSAPLQLQQWNDACARSTGEGWSGCHVLLADLLPDVPGQEVLLFTLESDSFVRVTAFRSDGRGIGRYGPIWLTEDYGLTTSPGLIDQLARGEFSVEPSRLNSLRIGGAEMMLLP